MANCKCNDSIKIKVKAPYAIEIAKKGDIGHDIRSIENVKIEAMETKLIHTGVYLELPEGVECQVRPKSGLSSQGILVHFGTVDEGYRGEVMVAVTNINNRDNTIVIPDGRAVYAKGETIEISANQKIAQLVFKEYKKTDVEMVEEISDETERGTDGFGSTGKF